MMRASIAIYRSIIKPAFFAGIACVLVWGIMRASGVTSVMGWEISLGWVFCVTFILMEFLPNGSSADNTNKRSSSLAPDVSNNSTDQARFRVRQGGRDIVATDGVFRLAKEPFEFVYDGQCAQQAIIGMQSDVLNNALDKKGLQTVWGRYGDGVTRDEGNFYFTDLESIEFFEDSDARAHFAKILSSHAPALLETLVSRDPRANLAMAAPRMSFIQRRLSFKSVNEVPIDVIADQTIYVTALEFVEGFRIAGIKWDAIYRMQWSRIVILLESRGT